MKPLNSARSGHGPTFLHAHCVHFEGHFLGYQLIRMVRDPLKKLTKVALPLTQAFLQPGGAALNQRLAGLKIVLSAVLAAVRDPRRNEVNDPIKQARTSL